ncbi:YbaB/EbfC family nucleoid-associated protein [Phytomonospora endophytica]|uniref:YbaB/EbfC family DNA-binding protein n=1 Tax=Phytomonospora endophytica TaxID=714109 RepID=A0A841FLP7_9ACTN|nr:YbaB/EbfC family nucleoid-associated protein [Phytomonospora endophytica]MBB6034728.1 hypothetical protein [Phytomonospora endophytica]GIG69068.1 hypothetical protein Pen01_53630 [Phytomonospora endophytica]
MPGLDALEREIAELAEQSAVDLAVADAVTAELSSLTGRAADRSGLVKATVGPTGALIDLAIDPRTQSWPTHRLARTVVETAQAAQRDCADAAADVVARLVPPGGRLRRLFAEGLRENLPARAKETTW